MKKIDVFLLAAGESSRMFPLSTIMEKSLLPVNGKPVIRHIIENLTVPEVAKHIRRIVICCLTKFKKQFEHEFRDMPDIEIKTFDEPLGTATTLYESDKNASEWIMVHYADCLTEIDYVDFIKSIKSSSRSITTDAVIAVINTVKHDYSQVICDEQEHGSEIPNVTNFIEKPKISDYSWSGIVLLKSHTFDLIMQQRFVNTKDLDIATHIFPVLVDKKLIKAYPYSTYWYDVGNLNSYRKVVELYGNNK